MRFILIIIFQFFVSGFAFSKPFLLSGKIKYNSDNIKNISLYKWNNIFSKEFIATISIIENEFLYINHNISEIDIYSLSNSNNNQSIAFVWDGEVKIVIDSTSSFYSAKIENSPISQEYTMFNESIYDSLFLPIRNLDTSISQEKLKCPAGCNSLDSLNILRAEAESFARNNQIMLMLSYVRDHPDSFVSLYILTKTGMEFDREDYKRHFSMLDEKLKQHSRAAPYR